MSTTTKIWRKRSAGARTLIAVVIAACAIAAGSQAQGPGGGPPARDPGVRGGSAAAGKPLATLSSAELVLFNNAMTTFREVDSVLGTLPGETGNGLGPSFNLNSCAGCHVFPALGGTSPQLNPQVSMATLHSANNRVPSFITLNGPIREARFKTNPDGTPDGGVHDLFVITGRVDAPSGCQLAQTDFASQVSDGNVIFRIPRPYLGPDSSRPLPTPRFWRMKAPTPRPNRHSGYRVMKTATPTMAPSRGSAGRRRTNRC